MASKFSSLISNPMGYVTVLILAVLVFNGLIYSLLQFTLIDNRAQSNQTSEIRDTQIRMIQEEQNQTQELLPVFFKSFNQTDLMVNLTNQVLNLTQQVLNNTGESRSATNETKQLITFLTDNFGSDSGYIEKENFQYQQANKTFDYLEQSLENQKRIMGLLNQTNN